MYIHIGGDVSLLKKNIIALFDMDNTTVSKWTRQYLQYAEDNGKIVNVSDEIPRTFIISKEKGRDERIYLSPVSVATLLKRAEEDKGF